MLPAWAIVLIAIGSAVIVIIVLLVLFKFACKLYKPVLQDEYVNILNYVDQGTD